ncbi:MAG TPA: ATP-dependent 6-phosphofructokinase [Candidatus Angelobacter sp.]|nr:ATP-dependent 6-phosphofructokinase [Candidatus Angelobacter sp.]
MSQKTIAICTGGGDCPGLNAVIRAVVKSSISKYGWRVLGVADGFDGLIWPEKSRELTLDDVSGILPRGGTILGTTNRGNPFSYRVEENGEMVERDFSRRLIANAKELGVDSLVVIGGDGTLKIAMQLQALGLNVIGVPKTIDNDLSATEVTFGFDTALHTATDAIDKIHTTAESHHRIMLVEVMGRDAGWIAVQAGIAGGAHVILIPEIPFTIKNICDFVHKRRSQGKKFTIVVVAEGAKVPHELEPRFVAEKRALPRSGSVANLLGDAIARCSRQETRVTVLGHIQRGGVPSPFDRILATRFGVAATEVAARQEFGRMVCLKEGRIQSVELAEAVGVMKDVQPDGEFVKTAKAIGICFGD